jgi:hypothetical protein
MSVQDELEKIRKRNLGLLRPEDVVQAAKPKSSPLHNRFDWDDGTAAHNWRLEQARHIIRVFVQVLETDKGTAESRVFVALSSDKSSGGGYRVLTDVLCDDILRKALLQDAYEDMRRFTQKYSALKELADVFNAMDKAKRKQTIKTLVAR